MITLIKCEAYESEPEATDDDLTDDDMALPDLIPKLEPDYSDDDLPDLIDQETSSYADIKNEIESDEHDIDNRIKTEQVELHQKTRIEGPFCLPESLRSQTDVPWDRSVYLGQFHLGQMKYESIP